MLICGLLFTIVVPSIMLNMQYRMHPNISRFPSTEFYNHRLLDGTVDSSGNVFPSLQPPSSAYFHTSPTAEHQPSVVFLDHTGAESSRNRSKLNYNEAYIVCNVIEDLLLHNPVSSRSMGCAHGRNG